jgi:hypothetical protein
MAIQATSSIVHNHGTYQNPYFRLVPRLAADGGSIPVDCYMYPSKEYYKEGNYHLECIPIYVDSGSFDKTNKAKTISDKFLFEVTKLVLDGLQNRYPDAEFEIVDII